MHRVPRNYRKVACHLEDFLFIQVVEDDVIDSVEKRVPCLFAFVIQVADLRQHLNDDFTELVESFFRNASSLVIFAHFIQQFYNFFHSAWLSQTVYGCTEHRPKGFNFRVEKRERFLCFYRECLNVHDFIGMRAKSWRSFWMKINLWMILKRSMENYFSPRHFSEGVRLGTVSCWVTNFF